jgi:hypothetical protein
MDAQLEDVRRRMAALEGGLDKVDTVLRGGRGDDLGLVAQVVALREQAEERRQAMARVEAKLDALLKEQTSERSMAEGERRLVAKVAAWGKVAAWALGIILTGGGAALVWTLQRIAEVLPMVAQVPR